MAPATNRKLQTDIDRCLKKVIDGRAEFEELWLKVQAVEVAKAVKRDDTQYSTPQYSHQTNKDANLREKLMGELKRSLKKLQRLRDQIRGWAVLPEIRDPAPLHEARRSIELDMERFKVCERESKTKAFSKVGLQLEDRVDPNEAALQETADWLRSAVLRVEEEIELFEADLEAMGCGEGRAKGPVPPRAEELDGFIERHRRHIVKLEQVLRLLENEQVTAEEVNDQLKDAIEYYIDSSTEPHFDQCDEDLYEPLPLDAVDENIGKLVTKHERPAADDEEEPPSPPAKEAKPPRQSKSAKKAAARAAAAEAEAAARRVAITGTLPESPAALSPGTPSALEVATTGSRRASSDNSVTQPVTPGSARSITSGSNWAELFSAASQPQQPAPAPTVQPQQQQQLLQHASPPASAAQHKAEHLHAGNGVAAASAAANGKGSSNGAAGAGNGDHAKPVSPAAVTSRPPPPPGLDLPIEDQRRLRAETAAAAAVRPRPAAARGQQPSTASEATAAPATSQANPAGSSAVVLSPTSWPTIGAAIAPAARRAQPTNGAAGNATSPTAAAAQLQPRRLSLTPADAMPEGGAGARPEDRPLPGSPATLGATTPTGKAGRGQDGLIAAQHGSPPSGRERQRRAAAGQPGTLQTPPSAISSSAADEGSAGKPRRQHPPAPPPLRTKSELPALAEDAYSTSSTDGLTPVGKRSEAESALPSVPGAPLWFPETPHYARPPKQKENAAVLHLLECAQRTRPQPADAEWHRGAAGDKRRRLTASRPVHPTLAPLPASWPAPGDPLPEALSQEGSFRALGRDMLLFAFHFQQGTEQQLWAARELKAQNSRYHTAYRAWFNRASEPRVIKPAEYEQGVFWYFDWHLRNLEPSPGAAALKLPEVDGWCWRATKADFKFEYSLMEDDASV